jgi:cytochrome c556
MLRKWSVLGGTVAAIALLAAGLSLAADDDDSPLHKVMEKVQATNVTIIKNVRTAVQYKKGQSDVAKAAEELVKLGKEAKPLGDGPAKAQNKSIEDWNKLSDAFIKEAEQFSALVAKSDTEQAKAKDAYKSVSRSCTACHEVFRVDE